MTKRHEGRLFGIIEHVPADRALIERFCTAVEAGRTPDQGDLAVIAQRLRQALAGVPAKKALGLETGKGNKRRASAMLRDQLIALEVEEIYQAAGCARGSLTRAMEEVGERYAKELPAIKKIANEAARRQARRYLDEERESRGKN